MSVHLTDSDAAEASFDRRTLPANAAPHRVSLVTGGTDGIGRAVALRLARGGDRVLVVGRDAERGAQVLQQLRELRPGLDHAFLPADLSLLADTARLADAVRRRVGRLDALVCCAGVLSTLPEWTCEGLERSFVLNYLGRYLLALKLLRPLTRSPSGRLVLVANAGVYRDTLDFGDLQYQRGRPGLRVAARTQFANDLFAVELAERVRATRVEVTCVSPGVTRSALLRNGRGLSPLARGGLALAQRLFGQSAEQAAQTPVFLAQHAHAVATGGGFFGPGATPLRVPSRALRRDRRALLWHASERLARAHLHPAEGAEARCATPPATRTSVADLGPARLSLQGE
jgi:NAD(P)-dependent dehydrogenase (short-subunit alcohol dehydrogenase family)